MAIKNIVETQINVTGQETVKQAADAYEDLGDAVSQTQLEAERLAQQFGINDERTQEAIRTAGRYKQEMEELDFAIDAARGGSDQLFRAAQGVTAGFEVAAGATALFGGQSEVLEKTLLRVQGALALSQGLKDLKEFGPALKALTKDTLAWVRSLRLAKLALAGLGIGALIAAFTIFRDSLSGVIGKIYEFTDAIGLTNKAQEKQIETQQQSIDSMQRELDVMTARGESEEKLYQQRLKIAQAEEQIAKDRLALLEEGDEGYQDAVKAALDAANQITVIEETESKRLKDIRDANAQEQKDKEKERLDFLKQKAEQYADEADTFLNQSQRKRLKDLKHWYDEELALVIGNIDAEGNLFDLYYKKKKQLADDFAREDRERLETQLNDTISFFQISGQLVDAYAKEDENKSKKSFEINKGISTAEAIVNTYTGATAALATKTELYPYERFVRAALVISTGLAQIAQIQKTKYNSQATGGSIDTSVGGFGQSLNAPAVRLPRTEEFTGERRVYVTEYDISNTQEKVRVTEDVSIVK